VSRADALRSLQDKLRLEREFKKGLDKISDDISKDYVEGILNLGNYDDILDGSLKDHYQIVGDEFSTRIGEKLKEEKKPTGSEIEEIAAALLLYYLVRAPKQRKHIQDTTAKNIIEADKYGKEYAAQEAEQGRRVSAQEEKIVAGNKLNQHLKGRAGTIAARETQDVAETAKHAEVSVLTGGKPDFIVNNRNHVGVKKRWWTKGDELVRRYGRDEFDHVTADQQEVDTNSPFSVSGESLMYPGDENLGASLGNIINCRCGAEYNIIDVEKLR